MFLPVAGISIPGLPDLTKYSVTSLAVLLAVLVWDAKTLAQFQLRWFDMPMVLWCLTPGVSAMTNGFGLYDALSAVLDQLIMYGFLYVIGRTYFRKPVHLREFAILLVCAVLVYVPLILYELRMSPQLHRIVYGYHPTSFHMQLRFGGYRPTVLMGHGIMVSLFVASAALAAWWLWRSKSVKQIWGLPIGLIAGGLIALTVLCRSIGTVAVASMVLCAYWLAAKTKQRVWVCLIIAIIPGYILTRGLLGWSGEELVALAAKVSPERAASLEFRMGNEDSLVRTAMQRPVFGWRGYGMNTANNEITDGLWVIVLGQNGIVGVTLLYLSLLLPSTLVLLRAPVRLWSSPSLAPVIILSSVPIMFAIDSIPNAFPNPLYIVIAGGLAGVASQALPLREQQRRAHEIASTPSRRHPAAGLAGSFSANAK